MQELLGVIHSSVSGFSGAGHCPNLDCAVSELTLSTGSQTCGVGEDRAEEKQLHTWAIRAYCIGAL